MNFTDVDTAVANRAPVRITERSGHAVGMTGILLGYNDCYDNCKVGFVDSEGAYTGEYTTVSRSAVELLPTVGMGASFVYGSDREPGTIVAVDVFKSGERKGQVRRIHVQYDDWNIVSGNFQSGNAVIEYTPNPNHPVTVFTQRADGRWYNSKSSRVVVGVREYYQNPHF